MTGRIPIWAGGKVAQSEVPRDDGPTQGTELEQALRYAEDLRRARTSQRALLRRREIGPQPARRKILIVDDEEGLRTLVAATLDEERYELLGIGRGIEGLVLAREWHPALILLDVRMPDISGIEVCRSIRADPTLKRIPVVMLTAAHDEADRQAGMQAGATCYLTKPFSPLQLLDTIEELLS